MEKYANKILKQSKVEAVQTIKIFFNFRWRTAHCRHFQLYRL